MPQPEALSEAFAERHVHLPVDVDVGIGENLRLARQGGGQQQRAERDDADMFGRFHGRWKCVG